jgi:hypothetical protein
LQVRHALCTICVGCVNVHNKGFSLHRLGKR